MKSRHLRLLVVEDNPLDVVIVQDALAGAGSARFLISRAETLQQAVDMVCPGTFDAVLLDLGLPDSQGLETFMGFRCKAPDVPVVVVSGLDDESLAVEAVREGAQDYLVKDWMNAALLSRSLVHAIERQRLLVRLREAQCSLRESEQRFRALFETTQDCIYVQDRSLKYTLVNPVVERLFGLPASAIQGLTHEDLFDEKESSASVREVSCRVLQGECIEEELTRRIKGVPMTFLETRTPLQDNQGNVVGIFTVSRDITERKRPLLSDPEVCGQYPSVTMSKVLALSRMAAERTSTILLLGESGSGKDHLAKYIHAHSKQANGPFFSINCAAVPPELAESELFGHEKGAFTGAHGRKRGLLELSEGGTLLLNEIGELSPPLQVKLLTFLDSRRFTRVGGEKEVSVNARLLAATNRDLQKEVDEGTFRKDLFYRLNVMVIEVPPLRERREDIPILAQEIIVALQRELQLPVVPILDSETLECMNAYHWPGNIRELRNTLERALILSEGKSFEPLINELEGYGRLPLNESKAGISSLSGDGLHHVTHALTKRLCEEALRAADGNKKAAARALGISRDTLYRYLKKFSTGSHE